MLPIIIVKRKNTTKVSGDDEGVHYEAAHRADDDGKRLDDTLVPKQQATVRITNAQPRMASNAPSRLANNQPCLAISRISPEAKASLKTSLR